MKEVKIGLIGYGTIGQGVVKLLRENQKDIEARIGGRLQLVGVADKDWRTPRKVSLDKTLRLNDAYKLINDPEVKIIIELVGNFPGVKQMLISALKNGKAVVTANKALLAQEGDRIFQVAKKYGSDIYFGASVAGGIPILRILREGLSANRIQAIYGIVNGTCNYILTRMQESGLEYSSALKEAQAQGYAEANPEADVEGIDASHKLAILLRLGFGVSVPLNKIFRKGISRLSHLDLTAASELKYRVKLLAIAKETNGFIEARVHPTLIPERSMLAQVNGVYNAIYVKGNFVGPTLFYGQGAGMDATASAVMSDVMELARNILQGRAPGRLSPEGFISLNPHQLRLKPMEELIGAYYLRFWVKDQAGVLAKIGGILGKCKISINSVIQHPARSGNSVPLVIITHNALEKNIQKAVAEINRLAVVLSPVQLIRIATELE
jgi:homoserine dehydrogenase